MKRVNEKHLPYYVTLESVKASKRCFLCALEEPSLRRYLESLLYERVNDSGVRADLKASHGFCHRHAHLMAGSGNAFCAALLYQDQVEAFAGLLDAQAQTGSKRVLSNTLDAWVSHDQCPACRFQAGDRERYIATFLQYLDEDEMRTAFEVAAPLCVPHLCAVLRTAHGTDQYRFLVAVQGAAWKRLSAELGEFIRKRDHQFASEALGDEGDSWHRAVDSVSGNEHVF